MSPSLILATVVATTSIRVSIKLCPISGASDLVSLRHVFSTQNNLLCLTILSLPRGLRLTISLPHAHRKRNMFALPAKTMPRTTMRTRVVSTWPLIHCVPASSDTVARNNGGITATYICVGLITYAGLVILMIAEGAVGCDGWAEYYY